MPKFDVSHIIILNITIKLTLDSYDINLIQYKTKIFPKDSSPKFQATVSENCS